MAQIKASSYGLHGKQFDTRIELSRSGIEHYLAYKANDRAFQTELRKKHGWVLGNLIWDILQFRGVEDIFVDSYQFCVKVNAPNRWDPEIDTLVCDAIDKLEKYPREPWPGLKVKTHPNRQMRTYHCHGFEVSQRSSATFMRPIKLANQPGLTEVGEVGEKLARGLMAIDGVVEIFLEPQAVTVAIAPLFTWEEIQPQVIDQFKLVFDAPLNVLH